MIEERIEHDGHSIVDVEICVTCELRRDEPTRVRLATHDPDVERLLVEEDSDVGELGRLAPFEWFTLRQRPDRGRPTPVRFIEPPVHVDRARGPLRGRHRRIAARTVGLLCGQRRTDQPSCEGEERCQAGPTDVAGHQRNQRASKMRISAL